MSKALVSALFQSALVVMVISVFQVQALTAKEFIIDGLGLPEKLTMTRELALMDSDRIAEFDASQLNNLVIFVPSNAAWEKSKEIFDTLNSQNVPSSLRENLVLAVSGELLGPTDWRSLMKSAEENGGVLDTAYGSSYFLHSDLRVCLTEWDDVQASFIEGACARVDSESYELEDVHIFVVDDVVLPESLKEDIAEYAVET